MYTWRMIVFELGGIFLHILYETFWNLTMGSEGKRCKFWNNDIAGAADFFLFIPYSLLYYSIMSRHFAEVSLKRNTIVLYVVSFQKGRFTQLAFISSFLDSHFIENVHHVDNAFTFEICVSLSFANEQARMNWTTTHIAIQLSSIINNLKYYWNKLWICKTEKFPAFNHDSSFCDDALSCKNF